MTFRVLDLFSGIGGFSLGLERTGGFKTVAFCEIEPYCRAVLKKHWPDVPQYDDVRTLTADRLRADGVAVDVICGGFPCQDLSLAGAKAGIDGERSGLWAEIARLVGELRPRHVIVENVANLLAGERGNWFGRVLGDLAALGYDAEWHCIPAGAIGAPHIRDRVWLVAHPDEIRCGYWGNNLPDDARFAQWEATQGQRQWADVERWLGEAFSDCYGTASPSELLRVDEWFPNRLDRCSAVGNAVVPQIPEIIGRAILQAEGIQ